MELFFQAYQYYLEHQGFFGEAMGTPLFVGVTTGDTRKIVAGSAAVAVLVFGASAILRALERRAALAIRIFRLG